MTLDALKSPFFILFIIALNTNILTAQTTIIQDHKLENLLQEKRKINTSITATDKYKVQIFYGDSQGARKVLADFKKSFPDTDATIVFSSPNYKVQVGNYKSKLEADRNRIIIREKFTDALVVKPSR
jgi:vancomycin resistance protein YoaR